MSHHGSSPRFIREISVFASRHLTPKQLIFTLALLVGVGSAITAWVLKTLIEEIALLLTSHFDVTSANRLYLVYPVVGIFLCVMFVKFIVRDDISHGVTKILYALSRRQGDIRSHNCWSSVIASLTLW